MLDKLLFMQGGKCFFCKGQLNKEDASVEHLVAVSREGKNTLDNCVACCKQINQLFGNMSVKEKLTILLNQSGTVKCPKKVKKTKSEPKLPKKAVP